MINFGIIPKFHWFIQQFLQTSLFFQAIINELPSAIHFFVNFTFAIFSTATLAIGKLLEQSTTGQIPPVMFR